MRIRNIMREKGSNYRSSFVVADDIEHSILTALALGTRQGLITCSVIVICWRIGK